MDRWLVETWDHKLWKIYVTDPLENSKFVFFN